MIKMLISLDEQQIQRIEQIVMDKDELGALRYLEDLRKKMKCGQAGCNPMDFKTREDVERIIDKTRKQI